MKLLSFGRFKTVFYILGAILASLFLYTMLAQAGAGAIITVNSADDDSDLNGNCTLREAIEAANDDIAVDACPAGAGNDFIEFDASTDGVPIVLTSELVITEAVGIQGNGQGVTIIDGGDANRIFRMDDTSLTEVTLYDMTLQNASGGNGGAIYAEDIDQLTIVDMEFDGNTATNGGVFYLENGTALTVLRSTFTNNTASVDGGVVYVDTGETVDFSDSTFTGNSAGSGGVAYVTYGLDLVFTDSTFTSNSSTSGGGVLLSYSESVTVDGSTFTSNTVSDGFGGAIDIEAASSTLDITDSTFTGNTAEGNWNGGAIFAESASDVTIDGSTFTGNSTGVTGTGGAIVLNDGAGTLDVSDSTFSGNTAGKGGAIDSTGDTNITDSVFDNNSAEGDAGALYQSDTTQLFISDTTFSNNTAVDDAGALHIYDSETVLMSVTFTGNSADRGGAIYNNDSNDNLMIIGASFSDNSATDGGAIYTQYELVIANATFTGNSADNGGAIYNNESISIGNGTFSGNTAVLAGGALYSDAGNQSTFVHLTLTGNSSHKGNDIFVASGTSAPLFTATIFDSQLSCAGDPIVSGDYNVENGNLCGLTEANDLVNTDPQLQTLTNNGGDMLTHDLYNPAVINLVDSCSVSTDQIGTLREIGTECTPGALEHVNIAPVAVGDSAETPVDTFVHIDILGNDSDVDGSLDTSSTTIVSGPSLGGVGIDEGGNFDYTPNTGVTGEDTITYTVEDNVGETSNVATVTIYIGGSGGHNDAPEANEDSANTNFETAVLIDVLANDTDPDGSVDPTTVAIVDAATDGTTSVDATTGEITYTPDAGFAGVDTFTYIMRDDENTNSNVATVTVTVAAAGSTGGSTGGSSGGGDEDEVVLAGDCDFTDIAAHTYSDAIVALCEAGIIEGYRDEVGDLTGLVGANNLLNRAESQTILTRSVFGEPAVGNYKNCFPDTNEQWFAVYVCYAKDFLGLTGYLGGDDAGYMRPERTVSYEELVKMLMTSNEVDLVNLGMGDNWYQIYLDTAEDLGALDGIDFTVGQALTRGEAFQLMYNVMVAIGDL